MVEATAPPMSQPPVAVAYQPGVINVRRVDPGQQETLLVVSEVMAIVMAMVMVMVMVIIVATVIIMMAITLVMATEDGHGFLFH